MATVGPPGEEFYINREQNSTPDNLYKPNGAEDEPLERRGRLSTAQEHIRDFCSTALRKQDGTDSVMNTSVICGYNIRMLTHLQRLDRSPDNRSFGGRPGYGHIRR